MARIDELKAALEELSASGGSQEDIDTLVDEIEKLQAGGGVPDVPLQPVPKEPFPGAAAEANAAIAAGAGQIVGRPAQVQTTGDILPISRTMNVDPATGKLTSADGNWSWAVPNIVGSAVSAATLPGRVFQGEIDPMSEQGQEEAFNMASWIAPGMSTFRPTVAQMPKVGVGPIQHVAGAPNLIPGVLRPAEPPRLTRQELRNKNAQWNRINEISQMQGQPATQRISEKGNIKNIPAVPKMDIMRREMGKLLATRPGMFDKKTQELMRSFARGDSTADKLLAHLANRKSNLGLKAAWEVLKWGGLTGSMAQSSRALGYTGMLAAAGTAIGAAEKAASLAAKGARKAKTAYELRRIKKSIAGKQKLPLSEPAEPITPKYRPDAPAKMSTPEIVPEPETPTSIMQKYLAEEEAKPINPSGKIKMTIGEPTVKKQGSLAPKPPKTKKPLQTKAGEAQPKISASEARRRMRERETDEQLSREGKFPKQELKQTSPVAKKADEEVARAIREWQEKQEREKARFGGAPRTPKKGRGSY